MNLSPHFTLDEFVASEVAARKGIDNTLPDELYQNAIDLCVTAIEPARDALGPLRCNSGYRCKKLNTAVGGAKDSGHLYGQAMDVIPLTPGTTTMDIFRWFVLHGTFSKLIWEFGGAWVHVGYDASAEGKQILAAVAVPGKAKAAYTEIGPEQLQSMGIV